MLFTPYVNIQESRIHSFVVELNIWLRCYLDQFQVLLSVLIDLSFKSEK